MMALYVASHYKNSPDDLQLMADAPAHHLFVLLGMWLILSSFLSIVWICGNQTFLRLNAKWTFNVGPVDESKNHLPDILCVIQVCLNFSLCSSCVNCFLKLCAPILLFPCSVNYWAIIFCTVHIVCKGKWFSNIGQK